MLVILDSKAFKRGAPSSEGGVLTMELRLTGACLGCDPVIDGFCYIPALISIFGDAVNFNEAINTEIMIEVDLNSTDANMTRLQVHVWCTRVVVTTSQRSGNAIRWL
jgi:hypothetical protein